MNENQIMKISFIINMNFRIDSLFIFLLLFSCQREPLPTPDQPVPDKDLINAVDLSTYPELLDAGVSFYDENGKEEDLLTILYDAGIKTIRMKLWVDPADRTAGFEEVKQLSETLHSLGFKTWITLHYSDTWADPGQQITPARWASLSYEELKDSVSAYTNKVVTEMAPDYLQLGNELNSGFLHPIGDINTQKQQLLGLLEAASSGARSASSEIQLMIHYAGIGDAAWFFEFVDRIDYDLIGLSYYPIWHGKSLVSLYVTLEDLSEANPDKGIFIAETAYPFTLDWNDQTNNIVGLDEQLILPAYPASPEGQQAFIKRLTEIVTEIDGCLGVCYWGAELVAWKGPQATDGSVWENQALFDFEAKAVPALKELGKE